ncbi:unnamed protein product [Coffea canephora]|uniref:Germin-like protein n=1 Tax=Coffea canephora TaxID=49390 RepID=A0A068V2W0_COFCA|nr:unnamed protein product [Coffea canephora]
MQNMASYNVIHLVIWLTFLSLVQLPMRSHCADPGPLQDFCVADLNSPVLVNGFPCKNPANVTSNDFFFDGLQKLGTVFDALNVNLTEVDVFAFPALNTLGMSMNRVQFHPGGENPPHIHPRATELSLVTEGKLLVGWVSTAYVLNWKILTAGQVFVIPPGLVHFQLNVGKGNALFYAFFNSQNPGISKLAPALFASTPLIPDPVLTTAFNVNKTIIDLIKSRASVLIP